MYNSNIQIVDNQIYIREQLMNLCMKWPRLNNSNSHQMKYSYIFIIDQ
jgi:hypothetical protein